MNKDQYYVLFYFLHILYLIGNYHYIQMYLSYRFVEFLLIKIYLFLNLFYFRVLLQY